MFGNPTDTMILDAVRDGSAGHKLTKEQRILLLLRDGGWHGGREMALKVSHRFGGYLFTLKEKGVVWEKRRDKSAPKGEEWWEYRLVAEGRLF